MAKPPQNKLLEKLEVRVEAELKERLNQLADQAGLNLSEYVRRLLAMAIRSSPQGGVSDDHQPPAKSEDTR
jgi:predicted HicB family RNase H-like nuclease